MDYLFKLCNNLESLYISLFNTINENDMSNMLTDYFKLTSIKMNNFCTSKVRYMLRRFSCYESLESIDL